MNGELNSSRGKPLHCCQIRGHNDLHQPSAVLKLVEPELLTP